MSRKIQFWAFITFSISSPAWACPLCHTTTADEVRAGLAATMNDPSVLMAMALPFLAVAIVVGLLNYNFDSNRKNQEL